ncbi:hypothetical protein Tco_0034167 [Tanacetum coccineum]
MIAKKNKQKNQMEHVDLELGRDINVIQNTVQSLLDCVKKTRSFTDKFSPSIYMAPSTLRDLRKKSKYVYDLLQRVPKSSPEQTLEACVRKVAASIEQIKGYYAGIEAYRVMGQRPLWGQGAKPLTRVPLLSQRAGVEGGAPR